MNSFFAEITLKRVAIALVLAVLTASWLNQHFMTPFPVLLGRMVVIAMLLLVAFTLAGHWRVAAVPRWLAQVVAVVVATPLATFIVYLPTLYGGDAAGVGDPMLHDMRVQGIWTISVTVLAIAPLLALGALYRERDAQARNQALRFELEKSALEKQALDARLKLLHAQIEPHFLFNTLANVQALVEARSDQAGPVLTSLIAYLRAAMPTLSDGDATLGHEAALVRAYLELMHMRMPDRLRFAIDIPGALASLRFPAMALLTLVENAIRHGIDPAEAGGVVDVKAWRDGGNSAIHIVVSDTGVGLRDSAAPGTGLANLRERLQGFYGASARLDLSEAAPHGVCAAIVFEAPREGLP